MALEGHGIAFLPFSAVRKELENGRLVQAAPAELTQFQMPMDVRAYREKPVGKEAGSSVAHALWAFLQEHAEGSMPE